MSITSEEVRDQCNGHEHIGFCFGGADAMVSTDNVEIFRSERF